jgi:hypothetical protein
MPTQDHRGEYSHGGTVREIKVFGFWGEYGRKAET